MSERKKKTGQFLGLLKMYLNALGFSELKPDSCSLTWGGLMGCEWNVQAGSVGGGLVYVTPCSRAHIALLLHSITVSSSAG